MKKTLICLLVSLTLIFSTTVAVFAVDDTGPRSIGKDSVVNSTAMKTQNQ